MSSVSGDVGDLECQTIPIGLCSCSSGPWTWSLGQGIRVSETQSECFQKNREKMVDDQRSKPLIAEAMDLHAGKNFMQVGGLPDG